MNLNITNITEILNKNNIDYEMVLNDDYGDDMNGRAITLNHNDSILLHDAVIYDNVRRFGFTVIPFLAISTLELINDFLLIFRTNPII